MLSITLLAGSGCAANPGYAPIFKELVESLRRTAAAMKSARDTNSFKKASESILVETDKIEELRKSLIQLGKPNSASIKSVQPSVDELKALQPEIESASAHYGDVLGRIRMPSEEKLFYGAMALDFARTIQNFDLAARDFRIK